MEGVGALKTREIAASDRALKAGEGPVKPHGDAVVQKNEETPQENAQQAAPEERIERIAEAMDKYVQSMQRDIKISVHKATGILMVKVISKDTGKTIREIPSEGLLNLAAKMEEVMGLLLDENA